jgi:hypothetical protein
MMTNQPSEPEPLNQHAVAAPQTNATKETTPMHSTASLQRENEKSEHPQAANSMTTTPARIIPPLFRVRPGARPLRTREALTEYFRRYPTADAGSYQPPIGWRQFGLDLLEHMTTMTACDVVLALEELREKWMARCSDNTPFADALSAAFGDIFFTLLETSDPRILAFVAGPWANNHEFERSNPS